MKKYLSFNAAAGTILLAAAGVEEKADFGRAILNSFLGMGVVFLVLVFIIVIIDLFKYIPRIEQAWKKSKNQNSEDEINQED